MDKDWKPILNIPLGRVHVCSLHARLRILDKLLKLHVNYAWNMEPEERRVLELGLRESTESLKKKKLKHTTQKYIT